tara:strand:- start:131 stop:682 length:552 start_codon:yes stop_codon:yes gene_type:complete
MSYKKWVYKYKYLKAEVDEVKEKMEKYTTDFNKLFTSKQAIEKEKQRQLDIIESINSGSIESEKKPKTPNLPGKNLYKDLSKKLHPDKGGSEEEFIRLSEMYESKDVLGMYIKAEELGIEIDEDNIEDIELKFQESCNTLFKQAEDPKSTAAWVWCNTPDEQKPQIIEKFKNKFGIILKEKII